MDYILAIDHGTQSVRAMIFDAAGKQLAKSRVVIEPYFSVHPGWAEQDADYFWCAVCDACQNLWASSDIPKSAIRGVALTTQRATMINVDRDGKPLRPAIVWLDQRRAKNVLPVGGLWGMAFRLGRVTRDVARFQADAEVNWIALNQPDVWHKTYKYLMLSGYLTYKLTELFVDSVAAQVGYLPFDCKHQQWYGDSDWRWRALEPLSREQLPDLIPAGQTLGTISPQAAELTGIPARLPLISAGADKACEIIGAGAFEPHIGCLSFGTTATFNTMQTRYIEVTPPLAPWPAAIPGMYNPEIMINRGYWMVSWFKEQFAYQEKQIAAGMGIETEDLFDDLVNEVPPGSLGLTLQPYWMPAFKQQEPVAKGAVVGFGEVHTRSHIYRAILEGLAYALREGKEQTERRTRTPITELRISGGGSRSDAAMQITADVMGLPASRPHTHETSGLGAAITAAVGLKLHPDFKSAIRVMTRIERTFLPEPDAQYTYNQLYQRVYRKMYHRLRPLYAEIQKITGYPEM
jgi:sugar (pentulose or hexulose) kinase